MEFRLAGKEYCVLCNKLYHTHDIFILYTMIRNGYHIDSIQL